PRCIRLPLMLVPPHRCLPPLASSRVLPCDRLVFLFVFYITHRPPSSTLFPYTTLFRSGDRGGFARRRGPRERRLGLQQQLRGDQQPDEREGRGHVADLLGEGPQGGLGVADDRRALQRGDGECAPALPGAPFRRQRRLLSPRRRSTRCSRSATAARGPPRSGGGPARR